MTSSNRLKSVVSRDSLAEAKKILNTFMYWSGLLIFGTIAWKVFWLGIAFAGIFASMLVQHFKEVIELAKSNPATYILIMGAWAYYMFGTFNICFNIIIKCYDKIREQLKEKKIEVTK